MTRDTCSGWVLRNKKGLIGSKLDGLIHEQVDVYHHIKQEQIWCLTSPAPCGGGIRLID